MDAQSNCAALVRASYLATAPLDNSKALAIAFKDRPHSKRSRRTSLIFRMVIALLDMGSLKSSTISGSSNYPRTLKSPLIFAQYLGKTHFRGKRKSGHAESETGGHDHSEMTGHLPEMGGHDGLEYALILSSTSFPANCRGTL